MPLIIPNNDTGNQYFTCCNAITRFVTKLVVLSIHLLPPKPNCAVDYSHTSLTEISMINM